MIIYYNHENDGVDQSFVVKGVVSGARPSGFKTSSVTHQLCGLRQVTSSLCASVFLAVTWK